MRLFIYEDTVINVDNDVDAENLLADEKCERELTTTEIDTIFGDYANYAGSENTSVVDGVITFDTSKLPASITDLSAWLEVYVKPNRNSLLAATDFLYRSDIESKLSEDEKTSRDAYCQLLRDFPATFTEIIDPTAIVWPSKPTFENVTF
jgi:hypothetical protein